MPYGGFALLAVVVSPVLSQPEAARQPGNPNRAVATAEKTVEKILFTGFSVSLGNDYFAIAQHPNDRGITSDVEASLCGHYGESDWRSGFSHTVFREDRAGSMRRWDLGRIFLSTETSVHPMRNVLFFFTTHAEGIYRGDLKGDEMQDFVHHLPGINGDTLGHGLHDEYPAHARQGIALGAGGGAQLNLSAAAGMLRGALRLDGAVQLAPLATGLNRITGSAETRGELVALEDLRLALAARLTLGHVGSRDPALRLRGGYNNARGPLWGPVVESALKVRTGVGDYAWTSLFLRVTPSFDGTGTKGGSGAMGWVGVEVGTRPWFQ